ncbi:MAG: VOC family protein [Propionibacteriales bacterium]|nr:VOC family protein [Propionibacteriales bacterium]
MTRAFQVTLDCSDPARVGDFWAEVLGYVVEPPPEGFASWPEALQAFGVPEEKWDSAYAIVDPEGRHPRMFFQRVPEGKQAKNRVHLDVRVGDRTRPPEENAAAINAEVERLEAFGARQVGWREDFGSRFVVMQDVEGNEFCLT